MRPATLLRNPAPSLLTLTLLPLTACLPQLPDVQTDRTSDSDTAIDPDTFVKIPAGTFDMGSTPGQPEYGYGVHTVTLTHAYYVGVREVTQGEFTAVMGYDPASFTDCDGLGPDNCPVEGVTWGEFAAYANAVSDAAGVQRCYTCAGSGAGVACDIGMNPYDCTGYRLLTESEWEGAARCGTDTEFAGSNTSADVAWTSENSNDSTHTVAGLAPNACGLYDLSGNVWEWTQDWHGDYPSGSVTDPTGAESGSNRVIRGGGWTYTADYASVSLRYDVHPQDSYADLGFRLGRSSP